MGRLHRTTDTRIFNVGGNKLLFKYSNLLIEIYGVRKNVFIGAMSLLNFNKQNQCVEHGVPDRHINRNHRLGACQPAVSVSASASSQNQRSPCPSLICTR
jgi:hypothetical protein